MYGILRYLPKNHLSYILGKLARIPLPYPISLASVSIFAKLNRINLDEIEKPLASYRSIGDFFVRDLKPGARALEDGLLSPIDGTLRSLGKISDGMLPQIKDKEYSVRSLLQGQYSERYEQGYFFNLYLSPRDYHHVHSPVSGEIVSSLYIPGNLWPVNGWALNNISNLFAVNERLVTFIRSPDYGLVAVVMVGATNVGRMSVTYDDWLTNQFQFCSSKRPHSPEFRDYNQGKAISAGEKLGTFNMGSSVVLLFDHNIETTGNISGIARPGQAVQFGRTLHVSTRQL
ncbi:MAG: phosphatidylserine decarboxylase [Deltaproteobacteria bacterium]|nr:phosphatidylserine decarboxylase [Deltaproteobacteria bacterium]